MSPYLIEPFREEDDWIPLTGVSRWQMLVSEVDTASSKKIIGPYQLYWRATCHLDVINSEDTLSVVDKDRRDGVKTSTNFDKSRSQGIGIKSLAKPVELLSPAEEYPKAEGHFDFMGQGQLFKIRHVAYLNPDDLCLGDGAGGSKVLWDVDKGDIRAEVTRRVPRFL